MISVGGEQVHIGQKDLWAVMHFAVADSTAQPTNGMVTKEMVPDL